MLMEHFLDGDFDPKYLQMVARVRSEEYYVNMMIAWYFATALAKQYEATIPILEAGAKTSVETAVLSPWVQNKTIRKACESYQLTPQQKELLRQYRCGTAEKR